MFKFFIKNKLASKPLNKSLESEDLFDYSYDKPGTLPGTLSIEDDASPPDITLIDYSQDTVSRVTNLSPEECAYYLDTATVSWFDLSGLGSENILQRLGRVFNLHPLVLEDIVNVPQRPKIEDYQDQLLIIAQMVTPKENGEDFWLEQVSFVLGKQYLLTVQEEPEIDNFDQVRKRIRQNQGVIRSQGADYLAYALWDAIIDGFFPILEQCGETIDELEDEIIFKTNKETLTKIYRVRRELLALRRAIWPQRDAINVLIRDKSNLISENVDTHLKDCYDHIVQIIDIIETYRELTSGLMDVYLSAVSNKMNEIMRVLTIISTIFIPLTFIAGIYGMNFNTEKSPWNMPELNWYWGYPLCWAVMLTIAGFLICLFWRRGWFVNVSTRGDK
jgi:magnesium transporter